MSLDSPPFRLLPSVDRLLRLQGERDPGLARAAARLVVEDLRERMQNGWPEDGESALLSDDALREALELARAELGRRYHRRVLNATGVLLHTGLGRAPLCDAALAAIADVGRQGYVEVEAASGERGRRERSVAEHLCALTGAEAATVVNNNAAATLLALQANCQGSEVIVSRGELVEIGGGFRMPDVMREAGCTLVEVGATNKVRVADYANAIRPETGALLKVHPSNFRIEGFFQEASLAELVTLAREHGLLALEDLGSGFMLDERLPHDHREPTVLESVRSGADLVWFSGDKLLGGPQAGILVGSKKAVAKCAQHPLYRALRLDKAMLAALEATLQVYRFGEPKREIPVLRAMYAELDGLEARASALADVLRAPGEAAGLSVEVAPSEAFVGSGASPARPIESRAVFLRAASAGGAAASDAASASGLVELAKRLRMSSPAVFPRIGDDSLVLDLRSLQADEDDAVAKAVAAALTA